MHYTPGLGLQTATPVSSDIALPSRTVLGLQLVDAQPVPVIDALLSGVRRSVYFVNAHCANIRARDRKYAAALGRADMLLPDGIGIDLAARMTGDGRLAANLNGTDLVPALAIQAGRLGLSIYLIGGRPGTAEKAAAVLAAASPGLHVAGTRDGYGSPADEPAAVAAINASGADIVLVALGVPAQEMWIDRNRNHLEASLVMGVGALFDFLAGNVRRAPVPVRRARLEWAWRLAMEPRRMARRYLVGNLTFMARAVHHAFVNAQPGAVTKRAIDLTATGLGLLLLAPMLLTIAAAIRLDSPGPILFRQTRVGRNGRQITIYKFRSMFSDAEARRAALLATSDRQGVCFKSRNDPRITRVGRILRRWSLDEVPQLINVVQGTMSLVGPRPALPEEVAAYPARAFGRLRVKPGLTGIWQVSGRADIGFDKMIDLDLAYVRARSGLLDLMLIALTFRALWSGRGAY